MSDLAGVADDECHPAGARGGRFPRRLRPARALVRRARGDANDAIRGLLDLAPPKAVVIRDGQETEVPTAQVEVGDLLLIRPGAKVAVDAEVVEGESAVDESMVTGESLPDSKAPWTR